MSDIDPGGANSVRASRLAFDRGSSRPRAFRATSVIRVPKKETSRRRRLETSQSRSLSQLDSLKCRKIDGEHCMAHKPVSLILGGGT